MRREWANGVLLVLPFQCFKLIYFSISIWLYLVRDDLSLFCKDVFILTYNDVMLLKIETRQPNGRRLCIGGIINNLNDYTCHNIDQNSQKSDGATRSVRMHVQGSDLQIPIGLIMTNRWRYSINRNAHRTHVPTAKQNKKLHADKINHRVWSLKVQVVLFWIEWIFFQLSILVQKWVDVGVGWMNEWKS